MSLPTRKSFHYRGHIQSTSYDYIRKLNLYQLAGVREYWIVNPTDQTITTYFFEGGKFAQRYTFEDKIKVNIYDNLEIDFTTLNL